MSRGQNQTNTFQVSPSDACYNRLLIACQAIVVISNCLEMMGDIWSVKQCANQTNVHFFSFLAVGTVAEVNSAFKILKFVSGEEILVIIAFQLKCLQMSGLYRVIFTHF